MWVLKRSRDGTSTLNLKNAQPYRVTPSEPRGLLKGLVAPMPPRHLHQPLWSLGYPLSLGCHDSIRVPVRNDIGVVDLSHRRDALGGRSLNWIVGTVIGVGNMLK